MTLRGIDKTVGKVAAAKQTRRKIMRKKCALTGLLQAVSGRIFLSRDYLLSQNHFGTALLIRYVFSYVRQFAIQNFAKGIQRIGRDGFILLQP